MRNKSELDGLGEALGLLLSDNELAILGVFLDSEGRVPDPEDVRGDARHDKVVQVVVQRSAPLLQPRVRLLFHLVPVALRQSNHRASVAHILNELIRRLAQVQDLPRQEYAHHLLEVGCKFLLKSWQAHVLADYDGPLLIHINVQLVQLLLLEEVNQFEPAHLPIIRDALVLPATAARELVRAGEEQNEPHRQERHYNEDHEEEDKEQRRHIVVFPKDEIACLLEEV